MRCRHLVLVALTAACADDQGSKDQPADGGGDGADNDAAVPGDGGPDGGSRPTAWHVIGTTNTPFSSVEQQVTPPLAPQLLAGANYLGINSPVALYRFSENGPVRFDIGGSNAAQPPTPTFMQYGWLGGAPANATPTGGFMLWTSHSTGFSTGIGAFDEADGSGRVVSSFVTNSGTTNAAACPTCPSGFLVPDELYGGACVVSLGSGGLMSFGQQIDVSGGCASGDCRFLVLKVGSKYLAYGQSPEIYSADATALSATTTGPYLPSADTGLASAAPLVWAGSGSSADFIFGNSPTGVRAWKPQADGSLSQVTDFATGVVPVAALYRAPGQCRTNGGNACYWVLSIGYIAGVVGSPSQAIQVLQFDPGTGVFSAAATIPAPAGRSYVALDVAGSTFPMAVAVTQDSSGSRRWDLIDLAPLADAQSYASPLAPPNLLLSVPFPSVLITLAGWKAVMHPSDPNSAYLYVNDWNGLGLVTYALGAGP